MQQRLQWLVVIAVLAAAATAFPAFASAPPVGPLPRGPVTTIHTTKGARVAVAVPRDSKLSWRVARPVRSSVLRQVSEADVGDSVVIVYLAVGRGQASVVLALTRGEQAKAYRVARYDVRVS